MSVLANQTNATPGDAFFWRVNADTITAKTFVASSTIQTAALSTGTLLVGSISTSGSLNVQGNLNVAADITALNITATDTATSYFNNTQYLTSYNGANIHNLLLADQIQGSNLVQFPNAILSSITTTSISLDGNTLNTAGAGFGAELLLNGQPIATASTLTSSILTWSYWPAISNVDLNNFGILGGATVQADTGNFYNVNATNQITFATNLYGATGNLTKLNATDISTTALVASNVSTVTLQATTMSNAGTLTSKQADITTVNATDITTATLTTTVGGTVTADNGVFKNLSATNGASISGAALNLNGQNITGTNNISAQSASILNNNQVGTLTTASITAPITNSGFPLYINSSGQNTNVIDYWTVNVDRGVDFTDTAVVNINAGNGKYGIITLNANPGYTYLGVGSPVGGSVVINAQGGSANGVAFGGTIALNAYSGTGTLSNATSKITMNAAGILSWAGVGVPVGSVTGYNYIHGDATVSITAGSITAGIPPVGTVYLYAGNGTVVQNGLYTDTISPRNNGGDLYIQGYKYSGTQRNVRLSNVESLYMNTTGTMIYADNITANTITFPQYIFGGLNTSIIDLHTLNFIPQIYDGGLGTSINNIQLVHFVDTQNSAIDGLKYITFTQNSGIFNLSTLQVSSINGASFSGVPTIISTFTDLTTNTFEANTISTGSLYAYTLAGVSSIDGYSIAQLVSSVSPPTPAPSTFLQLYTSSLQAQNISTIGLQALTLSGVSSIDGYSIAQLVSSVSPPTPAPSTFTQLYTSSLQANGIFSPNYLRLQGQAVGIFPDSNYNFIAQTTGVSGTVNLLSQYLIQLNSPSTIVTGDLRYTTLFGKPYDPNPTLPTVSTFTQLYTSSLQANGISTANLTAGQILLNGVALSPQISSFTDLQTNTFEANQISTGSLTLSSIGGYSLSQLINQPTVSTFTDLNTSNFGASTAGILYQASVTLQVSSINGFNVSQFLSTPGAQPQLSTFNQLFTSSLLTSSVVAFDLSTTTLETSSLNGYNITQLLNQPTVSSFQQLYTSSLQALNISTGVLTASNISTQNINAFTLQGVSSVNSYSIAQLVSSVSPQPPIPSTVLQFYTSSLAANVITPYQTTDLNLTSAAYIKIHAGVGVNIDGDQCNVNINSANINLNAASFISENASLDWRATATRNVVLNSSNTLSIYNTNTAPPVNTNDLAILGQGNTSLSGQNGLLLKAIGTVDCQGNEVIESAVQTISHTAGVNLFTTVPTYLAQTSNYLVVANTKAQFTSPSTICTGDLRATTFNGLPLPAVTNTFTQLYAYQLSNNPAVGSGALGIIAATEIALAAPVIQVQAAQDLLLYGSNVYSQASNVRIIGSNQVLLQTPSTICSGDITATTFNGLPLPTGSGAVVSTFDTLYTSTISGNPLNYLSLIANRGIKQTALSTQTYAAGAWFSGDVTASTFNGAPLGSGGGWVGTAATDLNMNGYKITAPGTLDIDAAYNLNLNAGFTSNILTLGGASVQVLPFRRFEVSFGTTDLQLNGGDLPNTATLQADVVGFRGNSNITLTTPSTICSGDLNVLTINGLPPGSGGGWIGTATSDLNMATYSILNVANINGSAYPPPYTPTWVGTASSDLNMATFSISNVTNINGASYPPASAWNGTATSALNMNGYDIYSSNLNIQTTSVNYYLSLNDNANKVDLYSAGALNATGITAFNVLTPALNLSNNTSYQGGQITIDSNAQLSYATKASGYDLGSSCPIPLTQFGTARVVVSDTTDAFDVSVILDCAYEDTSFSVVATSSDATTNVYYPGVLSYAVEISGSNSFNIICRATATDTYNFNWIASGKYPKGVPT